MLTALVLKVKSQKTEEYLHCYFKEINFSVTDLGPQYSCQILRSNINSNNSITKLFGNHTPNLTNNDVMQYVMDYTASTFLPTNLYSFLPNLKLLAVRSSSVQFINRVNFVGFKNMQYLSLSDNNIETISSDTFMDLTSVVMINLRKNLLRTLHKDLFKNNILLKTLHLEANRIKTIPSDMFNHLKNLISVDLRNNNCLDNIYYKFFFITIQEAIQEDLNDNTCVIVKEGSSGSKVKHIITIVMIIVILLLFIELTCFVHKLKKIK